MWSGLQVHTRPPPRGFEFAIEGLPMFRTQHSGLSTQRPEGS